MTATEPGRDGRGWWLGLGTILVLALLFRLAAIQIDPELLPTADAREYQRIAANVLAGRGFDSGAPGDPLWHPKSWRMPGYPLFIAAHWSLFEPRRRPILISQAILDAATALLVVVLGRRLFAPRVALLAGFLYALHPLAAIQTAALGTETLTTFLLTSFLILTYRAAERPGLGRGAVAGLLFGLVLLVRPTPQLFLPFAMAFIMLPTLARSSAGADSSLLRRTGAALALASVCILVVSPWTARNYRVHGAFVPLSTLGGVVLNQGVSGIRVGDWWSRSGLSSIPAEDWARWRELGEVAGERAMRHRAIEVIRERPGLYALSVGPKLVRFWLHVSAGYGRISPRGWAVFLLEGTLLVLAALAFLRYRGPWVAAGRLLWLLVAYHSVLYALTIAEVRFSYVVLPCVMLPVAHAFARLRPRQGSMPALGPSGDVSP